jgi:hypothetical protein
MKRSNLFPPENHILEVKKRGKNGQPDVATWMMDLDAPFSKKKKKSRSLRVCMFLEMCMNVGATYTRGSWQ